MKCLNLWALPPSVLALPEAERLKLIKEKYTVVSDEGGFAQASHAFMVSAHTKSCGRVAALTHALLHRRRSAQPTAFSPLRSSPS